jgi:hypothetical protein
MRTERYAAATNINLKDLLETSVRIQHTNLRRIGEMNSATCFEPGASRFLSERRNIVKKNKLLLTGCAVAAGLMVAALMLPEAKGTQTRPAPPPHDGKLRIIAFGAHPDDAEFKVGGTAAMWAARGHHVKLVSMTNGDLGHYVMGGGQLARRRLVEVQRAAQILGIQTEVLDIHDGELMPTLENRKAMVRLIRDWQADIVLSHRPNDYNPDHRYVGVLAQDAAFMVTVQSLSMT